MRTFVLMSNGVARIMRTYALGPGGRSITPVDDLPEIVPAPNADEIMARWHPDKAAAVTGWREIEEADVPTDPTFKNAWVDTGTSIEVDMPRARDIHAERIADAQASNIARLKIEERKERLKGNTTKADDHAATVIALDVLDLNVLAIQIAVAPNPTALSTIWPALVPRP